MVPRYFAVFPILDCLVFLCLEARIDMSDSGIQEQLVSMYCMSVSQSVGQLGMLCLELSVDEWLENFFPAIHILTDVNIMFGLFGKDMQLINPMLLLGKQAIF